MNSDIEVNYNGYTFLSDSQMGGRMESGKYEVEEIELLKSIPDINKLSVLELGGCLGAVSVILNKKLDNPEKHIVIEANPKLIKYLEHNKKTNNCSFSIKNALLTSNKENNIFYSYDKLVAGSAHRLDNIESNKIKHIIDTIHLKELQDQIDYNFDLLVMDIEGGELDFLLEFDISNFKYILVELHENLMYPGFNKKCIDKLNLEGFTIVNSFGNSILLKK
tara:strand:- start:686 stop:1348 length:663 start_codon:yes stop_codon:yes gene_type:complete